MAIKLFRLDVPPERVHTLVAEFERLIAAGLTHGGIAAPLAAGIDGNLPYLAHEYVAADSLDVVVRDHGVAPPAEAVRVAVQLAGALDFADAAGVTHGALHPRDVLLSAEDTRMTGHGITRALQRVGIAAPVRRPYTAPERVNGASWDRRADVFSLAALVHELMWGRRVAGIGAAAADALTNLDGADLAALRRTFARALAEDPADRYPTALEFAAALQAACPPAEPVLPLEPEDVVIRAAAEEQRYADVEIAPPVVPDLEPDIEPAEPPLRPAFERESEPTSPPAGLLMSHEPASALERSRSAIWPLALALVVGVALGFGLGYAAGSRDHGATTASVVAAPPAPAGREFTESAVTEPPRAATTSAPTLETLETTSPAPPQVAAIAPTSSATPSPAVRGRGAPAAPAVADAPGRLVVRSTPAGARVFIDGRDRGRTPATVRDLARGAHRVRLVYEGYATEERRITITAARPAQAMTVALARSRPSEPAARPAAGFFGVLSVDSRPAGAKVYLDGKLVGTTPMVLPQVSAGSHAVHLEHDGYRRWTSSVRVVAGESNRVTASLER